jgi:hypothetical protein|tara:strand:- start:1193 stop:1324 length:132 start_codon:yes stop_codon:yes gene_type:complete
MREQAKRPAIRCQNDPKLDRRERNADAQKAAEAWPDGKLDVTG